MPSAATGNQTDTLVTTSWRCTARTVILRWAALPANMQGPCSPRAGYRSRLQPSSLTPPSKNVASRRGMIDRGNATGKKKFSWNFFHPLPCLEPHPNFFSLFSTQNLTGLIHFQPCRNPVRCRMHARKCTHTLKRTYLRSYAHLFFGALSVNPTGGRAQRPTLPCPPPPPNLRAAASSSSPCRLGESVWIDSSWGEGG